MKFFIIPFWFHPIEEHFLVCCVFSPFFIFSHCQIYLKNTPEYTPLGFLSLRAWLQKFLYMVHATLFSRWFSALNVPTCWHLIFVYFVRFEICGQLVYSIP